MRLSNVPDYYYYFRSNVPHGSILRRGLPHIWTWGERSPFRQSLISDHHQQAHNYLHHHHHHHADILGDCICGARPGGSSWSSHLCFPSNDKGVRRSLFVFVFLLIVVFVFPFSTPYPRLFGIFSWGFCKLYSAPNLTSEKIEWTHKGSLLGQDGSGEIGAEWGGQTKID